MNGKDNLTQELMLVQQYFRTGITRGALLVLDNYSDNDSHSPDQAARQPATYTAILNDLASVFKFLTSTPFDASSGRSLLDVTTVVVTAEFNRTMRQLGSPIDKTGTDHNTLANEVLIGGKGIKGGLVVGASDLPSVDASGQLTGVSGAHRQRDPDLIKLMGRPFDVPSLTATAALPAAFDQTQYLNFASVANTIYQLFGADPSHLRQVVRNGPAAPVLSGLLS